MHNSLILTYHNIVDGKEKDLLLYDVSLEDFRQQMDIVRNTQCAIRATNIVLTFDDGYKSWANEVFEVLSQYRLKAIFFICIKHLEEGKVSCVDILKLKNAGMEIGSHSVSHSYLNTLSETELFAELGESKKALESIIQSEVKYFSVPYGNCSERIVKIAQAVGYQAVFTSVIGINHRAGYTLKRISLKRDTSLKEFKAIIAGKGLGRMAFEQGVKDTFKNIVGVKNFHFLRNCVVRKAE